MSLSEKLDQFLTSNWGEPSTSVQRDLFLNFKKVMEESPLDEKDRLMNLAAIGRSLHHSGMENFAVEELGQQGVPHEEIREAIESAAIMGMLNTYYKFKGFLSPESQPNYTRAGLRMQSLAKSAVGKEKFEMMSFTVSVINGCPTCVSSHEKALTQLGVDADRIHDLARLAAIAKGLSCLKPN